ncbi:ATP-dependent DNA helicase [Rhizobacter sp. Root1221]|uniref:ATP-dependent DNA helicase n=1 Tax=Rhizobacter sp. Root1221 TaxID=1736433 RepID=UPI0006FBBC1E|nr:ATP-dependent DNA helicase [Rhizobacter sp. Root1221]KQV83915.1 ATP-dependent DNA helicase [Rhizobacter sp. Root1221]
MENPVYVVAVRALCEFAAKAGDLDHRFTPAPSAAEGIAGHAAVAMRRGPNAENEVTVSGHHGPLSVRGRADGFDPDTRRVEEVKTYRGDLAAMPANHRALHWAQVKVYGALLCRMRGLDRITVALVYHDIGTQVDTTMSERHTAADLDAFFTSLCDRFVAWAEQEMAHRTARDAALGTLAFPHGDFRPGQRQLAEAVYKAAGAGRCLAAQAPTGIGKTLGTVFPLLKACPTQRLDKVFFLAAKTPGRGLALEALGTLAKGGLPLRVLELVARDKSCEHPGKACHGESCPLARGFYDRLPTARQAAVERRFLDRPTLRAVAAQHAVCPYYLGQEMVRWADVVVGDYNYFFDLAAMLHGLTLANQWRVGLLVDEAHNLLDRARKMYSATLEQVQLDAVRRTAPEPLKPAMERLHRAWVQLNGECPGPFDVLDELPQRWFGALSNCINAVGQHLGDRPDQVPPDLLRFYFDTLHFARVSERFGTHSQFDITQEPVGLRKRSVLCLRNVVPAPFLRQRFAAAHTTTLFSATLSPRAFYGDTLGLPDDTLWVDVESPFSAGQLAVHVTPRISTRHADRPASVAPIAGLIARQYRERPGNYLAFFSSFEYLGQVMARVAAHHPDVPLWAQSRAMDEAARDQFLARFSPGGQGIGFAVLGGAFAEGIDLPGDRLIGAFIATLGLPQVNAVNETLRERLEATFGAGYAYAYLYPGLQKVVQAAGRVIRTPADRGVVHLIDDRFTRREVRDLLPGWWPVAEHVLDGPARAVEDPA